MNLSLRSIIIFLVLFVFSKEVIVFNEEILVLFTSFIFIYLTYNLASDSISAQIDERAAKIQQEFSQYKEIQQNTINHLISYHKKQRLLLKNIEEIFAVTKDNIQTVLSSYSKLFIKNFYLLVEDKLKKVLINELKYSSLLQGKIATELNAYLVSIYSSNKDKKNKDAFLTNAIYSLSNLK